MLDFQCDRLRNLRNRKKTKLIRRITTTYVKNSVQLYISNQILLDDLKVFRKANKKNL